MVLPKLPPLLPTWRLAAESPALTTMLLAKPMRPLLEVPLLSSDSRPPSPMVAFKPAKTGAVEPALSPARASVPAFTVTPPVKVLLWPRMSVPRPSLVRLRPVELSAMTPLRVRMPCGVSTVKVVLLVRLVAPLSVRLPVPRKARLLTLAPNAKSLFSVRAVASAWRKAPLAATVSTPVPKGPLVKAETTPKASRVPAELPAMSRPPAFTVTPPPKRLAPESWSRPLPDLVMPTVALSVELPIGAEMARVGVALATVVLPLTVTGLTLNVRVVPPRSTAIPPVPAPEIVETEPTLMEVAAMLPVRVRMPVPVVTCGPVLPPSLLKVRPARV